MTIYNMIDDGLGKNSPLWPRVDLLDGLLPEGAVSQTEQDFVSELGLCEKCALECVGLCKTVMIKIGYKESLHCASLFEDVMKKTTGLALPKLKEIKP